MSDYTYLCHHGIKGQRWGIRRYQNPDGTLTPEGRAKYGLSEKRSWDVDPDSDLGIKNRYQNFREAKIQLKARQRNYNRETREILDSSQSTAKKVSTFITREAMKPAYSLTGFQTNKAERFIENTAIAVALPTAYSYNAMNSRLAAMPAAEKGYKWVGKLTSPATYKIQQINIKTGSPLVIKAGRQFTRL